MGGNGGDRREYMPCGSFIEPAKWRWIPRFVVACSYSLRLFPVQMSSLTPEPTPDAGPSTQPGGAEGDKRPPVAIICIGMAGSVSRATACGKALC